jgi:hypothetical protein
MSAMNSPSGSDGVLRSFRQAMEGVTDLVGKHLTLARLELREDLLKIASRARIIAVLAVLIVVGYALAMAGLAVILGGNRAVGASLLIVGGAHVVSCGLGMLLAVRRLANVHVMDDSANAVQNSLTTLGISRS